MLTNTVLFELVINNNYDELALAIHFNRVNIRGVNRKSSYILAAAIQYRSVECFDLLLDAIPITEKLSVSESGLNIATHYYANAPNNKNKYFIDKIMSKTNVEFNHNSFYTFLYNIHVFNLFSDYILSNNPEKYLYEYIDMNFEVYTILFNYCLNNNLLDETIVKKIILNSISRKKEQVLILVKNTHFIDNIWTMCPDIIDQIFKDKMSNGLLKFFINLYNSQKPININPINSLKNIINYEIDISKFNSYSGYYYGKKESGNAINNFNLILTIDYNFDNNNELTNLINKKINSLLTEPWKKNTNSILEYKICCDYTISYFITILLLLINKSSNFELNVSTIDNEIFTRIDSRKNTSAKFLVCGLKKIIIELIKLNKTIPETFNFIKNDNGIIPLSLITNKM
jgi:hypothetical protein